MPWVLTVTAGTMDRLLGATLTTSNGPKIIGGSMFLGATVLENFVELAEVLALDY